MADRSAVVREYAAGARAVDIAEKHGCHASTVVKAVRRLCPDAMRTAAPARKADYDEVRRRYVAGEPVKVIAADLGIGQQTVSGIMKRHWPHELRRTRRYERATGSNRSTSLETAGASSEASAPSSG